MWLIYDLIYLLLAPLGLLWLAWRRITRGPGATALGERFGDTPTRPVAARCVWIHAVSLGEINATRALVAELKQRAPQVAIAVSSTTRAGMQRAHELYPKLTVFRFPLDFSFALRRVFERIRPTAIILMELEVWPNLVEVAASRNVPIAIANGRVTSEKSMRRFQLPIARSIARRMFSRMTWIGAQDKTFAERFVQLGAPAARVEITGSMKYDSAEVADRIDGQDEVAEQLGVALDKPLWVCGSTGPDEEALLLDAYKRLLADFPDLQLALIPRKPERFDEVAELICSRGFACLRRSGKPPLTPTTGETPRIVFLGDTLGELRKFYALATVVFVGRTLVPLGGSDLMEVAGLGKAMLFGPHTENFTEPTQLLLEAQAARRVANLDELVENLRALLRTETMRDAIGKAARSVVVQQRGATERTAKRILEILESTGTGAR